MTRLAFLPWVDAVRQILTQPMLGVMPQDRIDLERMWQANYQPHEAAMAIAVDQFERSLR